MRCSCTKKKYNQCTDNKNAELCNGRPKTYPLKSWRPTSQNSLPFSTSFTKPYEAARVTPFSSTLNSWMKFQRDHALNGPSRLCASWIHMGGGDNCTLFTALKALMASGSLSGSSPMVYLTNTRAFIYYFFRDQQTYIFGTLIYVHVRCLTINTPGHRPHIPLASQKPNTQK